MGYTTYFEGQIHISPPLTEMERDFLTKFSQSRRVQRTRGPFFVEDFYSGKILPNSVVHPQSTAASLMSDITDSNTQPDGQPGLWCKWTPTIDGSSIEWDGREKFYDSADWMKYLADMFIGPNPVAKDLEPLNMWFLEGHQLSGEIIAVGEEGQGDTYKIVVNNNQVEIQPVIWNKACLNVFEEAEDKGDYVEINDVFDLLKEHENTLTWGPAQTIERTLSLHEEALKEASSLERIVERNANAILRAPEKKIAVKIVNIATKPGRV